MASVVQPNILKSFTDTQNTSALTRWYDKYIHGGDQNGINEPSNNANMELLAALKIYDARDRKRICHDFFFHKYQIPCDLGTNEFQEKVKVLMTLTMSSSIEETLALFCNSVIKYAQSNNIKSLEFKTVDEIERWLSFLSQRLNSDAIALPTRHAIITLLTFIDTSYFSTNFQVGMIALLEKKYDLLWKYILSAINVDMHTVESLHGTELVSLDNYLGLYKNSLVETLFSCARTLKTPNCVPILDDKLYVGLLTLSKVHDFETSWASSALLLDYAIASNNVKLLKLIFPTLFKLINQQISYPSFHETTKAEYNAPIEVSPISLMANILKILPNMSKYLDDLEYEDFICGIIKKGYNFGVKGMCYIDAYDFSVYLTILGYMGAYNDKTKIKISKEIPTTLLSNILSNHYNILIGFSNDSPNQLQILEISNRLAFAACILLRSLSRSGSLLLTYFTVNDLIEKITGILELNLLTSKGNIPTLSLLNENSLQTLILGIVSNLIIGFSASTNKINIDRLFFLINNFYLENCNYQETIVSALSLIRNSLFSGDPIIKRKFLSIITLPKIFKFCDYDDLQIETQSFNILRNLLTETYTEGRTIYAEYSKYNTIDEDDFVEFLRKHLKKSRDMQLTIAICYTLVHFAASTVDNKIIMLKNKQLLIDLLDILNIPFSKNMDDDSFWIINTCVAWIIINLTHREENSDHDLTRWVSSEDSSLCNVSARSNLLLEMGFHEALKKRTVECANMDFVERASKAIFQLVVSTSDN